MNGQVTFAASQRSLNSNRMKGLEIFFICHYSTGSFSAKLMKVKNITNIVCILSNPLITCRTGFRKEHFKCNDEMVIKNM